MPQFSSTQLETIIRQFGLEAAGPEIESLGNHGGFSGAALWRFQTADGSGPWCLRAWPAGIEEDRVHQVHRVLLESAAVQPLEFLAVPRLSCDGRSWMASERRLLEVARWLPGVADFHQSPAESRLVSAVQSLARVHEAFAACPSTRHWQVPVRAGDGPPSLVMRRQRLESLLHGDSELTNLWQRLERALQNEQAADTERAEVQIARERCPAILALAAPLANSLREPLRIAAAAQHPLQICLRDVRHDHLLFTGDELSGLVDYDSMRFDSVAGDLARLLGDCVGEDQAAWQVAIAAYQEVRPLTEAQRSSLPIYDRANVVLSGVQWLEWLLIEHRRFADSQTVMQRLDEIQQRLSAAAGGFMLP